MRVLRYSIVPVLLGLLAIPQADARGGGGGGGGGFGSGFRAGGFVGVHIGARGARGGAWGWPTAVGAAQLASDS
jgi:hypothetical protein